MKAKKRKPFRKMKGSQGQEREEFYDPEPKDYILEKTTRLELSEEHLEDPIVALDEALKCVESSCQACFLARDPVVGVVSNGLRRLPLWEKPIWEGVWPYLDPRGIVCVYAQHPWSGMCQRSTGRMVSSFSS